jgi:hypothetical protein
MPSISESNSSPQLPTFSPDREEATGAADDSGWASLYFSEEDNPDIEALIRSFTESAAKKDTLSLLDLFALDEYISGYNTELMAEYLRLSPDDDRVQPPTYEERLKEIDSNISSYHFGFFIDDMNLDTLTTDDVLSAFKALDCESLTVLRIDTVRMSEEQKEEAKLHNEERASRFGAEAMDFRTMLLSLDDKTYYCGVTLIKYNGIWKFLELNCPLILSNPNSSTDSMTIPEYEELLNQCLEAS